MSAQMLLEFRNVGKHFGRVHALNQVSLRFPKSGIVALVGPNGAGKSTLLDLLFGEFPPTHGCIQLSDTNSPLASQDLSHIFSRLHQRLVVPEELSAAAFLALTLRPLQTWPLADLFAHNWYGIPDLLEGLPFELIQLLAAADVLDQLESPIGKLSFGQQRVIALTAFLSIPGKLGILLDEPFAGLADFVKKSAQNAIMNYAGQRLVVLAEHDLESTTTIADQLVVLVGGQLVAQYEGSAVKTANLVRYFMGSSTT